jgi:hypothetical protein
LTYQPASKIPPSRITTFCRYRKCTADRFEPRHDGAPLAALFKEQDEMQGKEVGVILSGGNVDLHVYAAILAGKSSALSSS